MRKLCCVLTACAFGLTGCGPIPPLLHVPDPHPTPLLEQAGDVRVAAGGFAAPLGQSDSRVGGDFLLEGTVQASASPVPHLGAFGAATYVSEPEHEHRYIEGGGALYGQFSERANVELLVGIGRGEVEGEGARDSFYPGPREYVATANLERTFVQANVWGEVGSLQLGMTSRFSNLRFVDIEERSEGEPAREAEALRGTYLEPGAFVRTAHRPVNIGIRWSFLVPLDKSQSTDGEDLFRERPFSVVADVTLDLGAALGLTR